MGKLSLRRATDARDKGKGKGGGKRERTDEFTVIVKGLPDWIDEETIRKDFGQCGDLDRVNVPMDRGYAKGVAFVQSKNDEAVAKAKEWHNTWYKEGYVTVEKVGEE